MNMKKTYLLLSFAMTALLIVESVHAEGESPNAPSLPSTKPKSKKTGSKLTHDTSESGADRRKVLLTTGEDKTVDLTFDVEGPNAITVGNPTIAAVQVVKIGENKRQLVFKPLKAGETTAVIRDEEGTIKLIFTVSVTGTNLLRRSAEIRDLLKDVEGLDVRIVGQKIIVDGEVLVPADYSRVLGVIQDKSYSDLVMNLVGLSPFALQVLAKKIQEDVSAFAPNVKARVVNGIVLLEGNVDSVDQAKRAEKIATFYLPDVRPGNPLIARDASAQSIPRRFVELLLVVNPPPPKKQEKLVRITVHFVELAKDFNRFFGFKWAPGFTTDPQITFGTSPAGDTGATGTSFTGTISSLFPKLKSAQTAGYARILKTGTVMVRSGQPAELNETTQVPYLSIGPMGQQAAQFAQVGLTVAVTPQILGQSEDISLDLDLGQVNLTGREPAAARAPITATHKVKTKLYVKNSESAAVGGVMSADVGTDFNKGDPSPGQFQGQTQELFNLIRSKNYSKRKTQFVIFVTPQIIENASEGTEDLKRNFRVKVE
jgi:pilus assembly protein CpaC